MDRHAQVDLSAPPPRVSTTPPEYPRLADAKGCEVVLRAGEALYIPAWWWHEVETLPTTHEIDISVSVDFRFDLRDHLELPHTLPIRPGLRFELARHLELTVARALGDDPRCVPHFMRAALAQLELTGTPADGSRPPIDEPTQESKQISPGLYSKWFVAMGGDPEDIPEPPEPRDAGEPKAEPEPEPPIYAAGMAWPELEKRRPQGVDVRAWEGLFELMLWKLSLLLGAHQALPFMRDMCEPSRFERLLKPSAEKRLDGGE